MIRYPKPESTAIISAATTTSHAMPSAIRKPTMICGSAAGKTTFARSCQGARPKLRPARRDTDGTLDTPSTQATTIGKKAPRKIRKIAGLSPTPKKMMDTGIHAIGLIGRRICIVGFTT